MIVVGSHGCSTTVVPTEPMLVTPLSVSGGSEVVSGAVVLTLVVLGEIVTMLVGVVGSAVGGRVVSGLESVGGTSVTVEF